MTQRQGSGSRLTLLVLPIAYFMVTLDTLVVVTALPSIHKDLGGGVSTLQWTVNAYSIAFAAGIITASAVGDRLGRRRVFRFGLGLFTAASAACALAPTLSALIAFRALQGAGAAIVMPLGLTLLTSAFPVERRGAVVGVWGGIAGLGVAAGPLIGGGVTQGLDWHWVFWVNVPIGIIALLATRLVLPRTHGSRGALDLPAMVLAAAGPAALVWGLVDAPQVGWTAPRTLGALAVAVVALAAFLAREATTDAPMIPLSMFRTSAFSAAAISTFLMSGATFSAAFFTSEFFQLARGDSPFSAGLRFLPWTAAPLLAAPVAGMLFDRIGARRLAVPGLAMQALGFAWISQLAHTHAGYAAFVVPFIIAGVGVSMALPSLPAAGMNAAPPELLGRAAGVLNTMQQLGAVIGIALVTVVFNANGALATPATTTHGYRPAEAAAAGLSALAAAVALAVRRKTVKQPAALDVPTNAVPVSVAAP
jgi:EmrB/QacA subfamily drug resistance transporter